MEETTRILVIPSPLKIKIEIGLKTNGITIKTQISDCMNEIMDIKASLKLQALQCKALIIDLYFYISWNGPFHTFCYWEIYSKFIQAGVTSNFTRVLIFPSYVSWGNKL